MPAAAAPYRARLVAVAGALPERRLTNADLERLVDTTDEWIVLRTGIRERRVVMPGSGLLPLAELAARRCLERSGRNADELDGIIVATITPDEIMPAMANRVQHAIGATRAWGFDLVNACNGFVAALSTASAFIESGRAQRILVLGGDVMSSIVDYTDRNTCVLFGDGCGAVLVERGAADGPGILGFAMHSDGGSADDLCLPNSGSRASVRKRVVHQNGKVVFQHAIRRMSEVSIEVLEQVGRTGADVDLLVPHQANRRIIEPTAERLGLPLDKVVINLERLGNTTGATIPLALDEAHNDGRLKAGTRCLLAAFGGGFTWGACYVVWG